MKVKLPNGVFYYYIPQRCFIAPIYVTGFAKRGLIRTFINIEKSRFEIIYLLITVYLDNAWCLVYQLLHHSIVIQGNSAGALFDGLLAELPRSCETSQPGSLC